MRFRLFGWTHFSQPRRRVNLQIGLRISDDPGIVSNLSQPLLAHAYNTDPTHDLDIMPSPPLSIVQALSPRIAVLTSDDVIDSCEANGCRGLEELLRPWEGGSERGT